MSFWLIDLATTRHIARSRELFGELKEKAVREHRVYMRNNTYSDVLGEGKCKFLVNGSVIVPSIHTNLMSVPILEKNGYEVKFKFRKCFL
jgi:hypothetical protein